jgi:hypothetical protein
MVLIKVYHSAHLSLMNKKDKAENTSALNREKRQ